MWRAVNSARRLLATLHRTLSQHIRPYTNWRWQCGSDGDGNCHEIIPGGERHHAVTDHNTVADKSSKTGAKRKSPEPDGLLHQFYVAAWEVILEDVLNLYCCILHGPDGERILRIVPRGTELEVKLRRGVGQVAHTCNNPHVKRTGVY
jgi:hypothetical protein